MSGSNKKIAIDELQHARKVKRSGTSGTKKVAKGGSAVAELAEAIAKLSDGSRTNSVIESYNKLVKHYDAVILAYVAKRDALSEASEEVEQLQTAIKEQKDDMKALKAKAAQLESTRRACTCKEPKTATSQAGRCGNCTCAKAGLECTPNCSCRLECGRPSKEKTAAMKLDKEVRARMMKIQKRKGGNAAREESESEDESESDSEGEGEGEGEGASESEEEEQRAKEKKKAKKRDDSDEEERKEGKKKSKKRDDSDEEQSEEEVREKGKKKKNKKRNDSDEEEPRAAAAARDDDAADSAAEMYDRLHVNDNDEGEMDE